MYVCVCRQYIHVDISLRKNSGRMRLCLCQYIFMIIKTNNKKSNASVSETVYTHKQLHTINAIMDMNAAMV